MTQRLFSKALDSIVCHLAYATWFTFHGWQTILDKDIVFYFDFHDPHHRPPLV